MKLLTRAKVNLHLDVIRRRSDGFHEIETVLQSVELADEINVEFTDDARIQIECNDPDIPTDENNLCHKAVCAMRPFAGEGLGARIQLEKKIPSEAGLGGGSSNAAGILLAARRALRLKMPVEELEPVAADIGSDVPFMLYGGTMLGRGRGEILTPLNPLSTGHFLIVKPDVSISTAWVYAGFNSRLTKHRPRINLKSLSSVLARFPAVPTPFRNALEDVVCPSHPVIANTLDELISEKPCLASMSGSGSALFAVFSSEEQAVEVAERFSVRGFFTSVVMPAKRAIDIE